jgi:hypothetical protein
VNLSISAINVNTLNISTYKEGACKTVEKLVAVTKRGSDVILMSDCRMGRGIEKVKRILLLGKRTSYDLYSNSTKGDRGVCIAISRARNVEVIEVIKDTVTENYILLRCKVDNTECILGCVLGSSDFLQISQNQVASCGGKLI